MVNKNEELEYFEAEISENVSLDELEAKLQ